MFSIQESYARHIDEAVSSAGGPFPSVIVAPDSLDAYQHRRILESTRPIIEAFKDASWVTVGDMGGDAHFLRLAGVKRVHATSLSDAQLRALKEAGHLAGISISAMNAESTGLPDGAYDFVFCKESFHHFPRPMLAFYELVRIARRGVIFIEPNDGGIRMLDFLRGQIKRILRGQREVEQQFETVGNFLYRFSSREVFKATCALQFPEMAVRYFNFFYWPKLSRFPIGIARGVYSLGCDVQNLLCALRLMTPGMITCYVSKEDIPDELRRDPRFCARFEVRKVPVNPYIGSGR